MRGEHPRRALIDESGDMPKNWLDSQVRGSMLMHGFNSNITFIGTPNGRNIFYDVFKRGLDPLQPSYSSYAFRASEYPELVDKIALERDRNEMIDEIFQAEYECNFDVSPTREFVYSDVLNKMEKEGRINDNVIYDRNYPVYLACDLGWSFYTSIWFFQYINGKLNFIDYLEFTQTLTSQICSVIKSKGYVIGNTFLPHDGNNHTGISKDSHLDIFRNFGLNPILLGKDTSERENESDKWDEKLGRVIATFTFSNINKTACRKGIDNLYEYRCIVDSRTGRSTSKPVHEPCISDCADALRMAIISKIYWEKSDRGVYNKPIKFTHEKIIEDDFESSF